ncbi:hypothetical protein [Maricaulis sp.]|uniref:hypothetical protein n=1 Tax=Maricaulis sp. TaxID=1486257 RepID=UPI0026117B46|nr:hypothetical protein [Maricaulis sp.]
MWRLVTAFILAPAAAILTLLPINAVAAASDQAEPVRVNIATEPVRYGRDDGLSLCVASQFARDPDHDPRNGPQVHIVWAGPGASYAPIDTALAGEAAYACRRANRQTEAVPTDWVGVVYGFDLDQCALDVEAERMRTYNGDCRWGWVEDHAIQAPPVDLLLADAEPEGD